MRDHIAPFGGDPSNVTVFGESVGAMSVCDLMGRPAARGLFCRAIAQSGPPVAAAIATAEEHTAKLFAELGCTEPNQLREVPLAALISAQGGVLATGASGGLAFTPVVDGTSVPVSPPEAFESGTSTAVPFLIGTNRDEAKLFMVGDPKNRPPDEDLLLRRIDRAFDLNAVGLSARGAIDAYRQARAERQEPTDPRELWSAIESDRMFRVGSVRAAAAHAGQADTYCYLFTWESPAMQGALGSCHALEIPFVLGTLDAPGMGRFAGTGFETVALGPAGSVRAGGDRVSAEGVGCAPACRSEWGRTGAPQADLKVHAPRSMTTCPLLDSVVKSA